LHVPLPLASLPELAQLYSESSTREHGSSFYFGIIDNKAAISPADIIVLCRCNIRVVFNTDTIKRNSGFARFPEFDVTDERKRKRKRFTMEVAIVEIVFLYTRGLMSRTFTLALRFYDIQCIIESDRVFELFCKFWITMITKITTG
jgi:hypothetical protein